MAPPLTLKNWEEEPEAVRAVWEPFRLPTGKSAAGAAAWVSHPEIGCTTWAALSNA